MGDNLPPTVPIELNEIDKRLVVVTFSPDALRIGQATVIGGLPLIPLRAGCQWTTYPLPHANDVALATLVETVRDARLREFNQCRFCEKMVPKEHQYESDVCHWCASEYLGVDF